MKKLHIRYIILSILFSSLVFGMGLFIKYIIDPAGINNVFDIGLVKDPELSSRTQKFVAINQFKPNSIMLGGSRVECLNPQSLQKYTSDKVYNLGLPGSKLEELIYFLKYSIDKFNIKNVVLGLNFYTFSEKMKIDNHFDFDEEIFKSGFTFQKKIKYYLGLPIIKYFEILYTHKFNQPLYLNGGATIYFQDKMLSGKSLKDRIKPDKAYIYKYRDFTLGKKELNTLADIVELCKENNINLQVYTTAIYASQFQFLKDENKIDEYYKWKKAIVKITPFWDFMYLNSISKNGANYIDPSHLRQEVGALYFAKIFGDTTVEIPEDFGVYVTENNINEHLKYLKNKNKLK